MKTKLISMLLAVSLIVASLTGCGNQEVAKTSEPSKESSSVASTQTSTVVQEEVSYFNKEGYPIVNEEITLKIMLMIADNDSIIAPEDMPEFKRLAEKTGIKTEFEVIKKTDWNTKLTLAFASGEYPDVIIANGSALVDYEEYGVEQGILIPVEELMDEYMPIFNERKGKMEQQINATLTASDGHLYTMPSVFGESYADDLHYFINEAWLEALNLDMPTDMESLTEVLRAFKNNDPNGNGLADEIPISATFTDFMYFTQLFGMPKYARWVYIDDNKQIQFVPSMEKFREFLEWAHMCYDEGILDKEILTQDGNAVTAKLASGMVGLFKSYRLTQMNIPGSEETCTLYLPSNEEARYALSATFPVSNLYITKSNKYPEATARWVDSLNEIETIYSIYYGEQNNEEFGWKYVENGKIELLGTAPATNREYLGGSFYRFLPEILTVSAAIKVEKNGYCDAEKEAGLFGKYADNYITRVPFAGENKDKKNLIEADLNKTMKEYVSNFIVEGVTDNTWEAFQTALKNIGADEYVKMYQEGLDSMIIQ